VTAEFIAASLSALAERRYRCSRGENTCSRHGCRYRCL